MSNTALLRKVRQVIAEHPERHHQSVWYETVFDDSNLVTKLDGVPVETARQFALQPVPSEPQDETGVCGTAACVAGWAAILAAPKGSTLDANAAGINLPDGSRPSVGTYAEEQLGITTHQAVYLFSGLRDRDQVLAELDYLIEHPRATSSGYDRGDY